MNSRLQSPLRYSTCYLKLRTGLANAVEHVLQLSIITAVFVFMRLGRLGAVAMMEMMGSWEVAQLPSCQYESTGVIAGQGEPTSNWPRVCGIALRGHL